MTPVRIPMANIPQYFSISLGGNNYNMVCKWNERIGWVLDISDVNNVNIVLGIPLATGRDLLEPYASLNFGGSLYALTDGNFNAPTLNNLGTDANLYFVTA